MYANVLKNIVFKGRKCRRITSLMVTKAAAIEDHIDIMCKDFNGQLSIPWCSNCKCVCVCVGI